MKITVETLVKANLDSVWDAWNNPDDINQWNAASDDWRTTQSSVDLREGGKFSARMEAKDGSEGFDFEGTYTHVVPQQLIEYRLGDGREVKVQFSEAGRRSSGTGDVRGGNRKRPGGPARGVAGDPGQLRQACGASPRLNPTSDQIDFSVIDWHSVRAAP